MVLSRLQDVWFPDHKSAKDRMWQWPWNREGAGRLSAGVRRPQEAGLAGGRGSVKARSAGRTVWTAQFVERGSVRVEGCWASLGSSDVRGEKQS